MGRTSCARRIGLALTACAVLAPPAAAAAPPPGELLARFQPVLTLAPGEPFAPTAIDRFLADTVLEQRAPDGSFAVVGQPAPDGSDLPSSDPAGCAPVGETPCWRVDQQPCLAALGPAALPCYLATLAQHRPRSVEYARVLRSGERIALEYWLFSYADLLAVPAGPDLLWQAHEGDWEAVTVVLDAAGQPLEAGYSQHCAGQRRDWAAVPLVGGTHPLVYVALGSHAGYFTPGLHPLERSCIPPQVLAVLDRYGITPADTTGAGVVVGPGGLPASVKRIRPHEPGWVAFPGSWGEAQYFHGPDPIGTVELGSSPQGPAFHALWSDPVGVVESWPVG